jgi:hypothetical protein
MQREEAYRGFVFSWQEPPTTATGFVMNIASEEPRLSNLLTSDDSVRRPFKLLDDAKKDARRTIDVVLEEKLMRG